MEQSTECVTVLWWIDWMDIWMAAVIIAILVLTYLVLELLQLASKPVRITHTRYVQTME